MKKLFFALLALVFLWVSGSTIYAQTQRTIRLEATINPGSLLTDVRDQFGRSIAQPVVSLGKVANSIGCRGDDGGIRTVLGSDEQRIYVDNPKAASDGWTLTLSPVDGRDAAWQSEGGYEIDYNDPGQGGCTDADNDGRAGLLSVDPSQASLKSDCLECDVSNISIGTFQEQNFAETDAVTLLRASDISDELGSWYMTNVQVRQTVPPGQEGDTYQLDLVLTATAT